MGKPLQYCLNQAGLELKIHSSSPRIDAELLLLHVLQQPRYVLFAYPETILTEQQQRQFEQLLRQRQQGWPIAYILGRQGFWSFDVEVNEHVLIPRPETELLVDTLLQHLPAQSVQTVADLGTGSGAIALAIAMERPHWTIYATDIDKRCLQVAERNAQRLGITNVQFLQGDWCQPLPDVKFDAIVSNPPYVAETDPHLAANVSQFEPKQALISPQQGLRAFNDITAHARNYLKSSGLLLFEHGFQQAEKVRSILFTWKFCHIGSYHDMNEYERITKALLS